MLREYCAMAKSGNKVADIGITFPGIDADKIDTDNEFEK